MFTFSSQFFSSTPNWLPDTDTLVRGAVDKDKETQRHRKTEKHTHTTEKLAYKRKFTHEITHKHTRTQEKNIMSLLAI
jgi:hypothetical protein